MSATRRAWSSGSSVAVYTPLPDTAQDLMDMYGVTAEQAGDGSPDLVWLLREKKGEARPYSPGDRLPFGADVFSGHKKNDTVLSVESQRAVISGDTLGDFGRGLEINEELAPPWCDARGDRRRIAPAARATRRARARNPRRADRPGSPRARVVPPPREAPTHEAGASARPLTCARPSRGRRLTDLRGGVGPPAPRATPPRRRRAVPRSR